MDTQEGNGLAYYTLEKWLEAGADMAFSTRRGGWEKESMTRPISVCMWKMISNRSFSIGKNIWPIFNCHWDRQLPADKCMVIECSG
jgi:hypothetical protein